MEKVKITQELANLLNGFSPNTDLGWIFSQLAEWKNVTISTQEMADLHHFYIMDPLLISKALIVGYEVEETPEDKVKSYYVEIRERDLKTDPLQINHWKHEADGIRNTVILLGLKIKGIN